MWECFSYFNRFIFWHFTSLISLCHTFRAAYTRSCRCLECTGGSIQLASLESSVWLRFIRTGRCVHAQYGFLVNWKQMRSSWSVLHCICMLISYVIRWLSSWAREDSPWLSLIEDLRLCRDYCIRFGYSGFVVVGGFLPVLNPWLLLPGMHMILYDNVV